MKALRNLPDMNNPHAHFELLSCPDCIYLSERGNCALLNVTSCMGERCTAKESSRSKARSLAQWKSRLCGLPLEKQEDIAKKYYGGHFPWKD